MDRFLWLTTGLEFNEKKLCTQRGVKIYDGEDKVGETCVKGLRNRIVHCIPETGIGSFILFK